MKYHAVERVTLHVNIALGTDPQNEFDSKHRSLTPTFEG